MATTNFVRLFARHWREISSLVVLGVFLALAFSLLQPLRYSSTERVLITQGNLVGVDPYTAIKSAERIAQNISEVIYSSSFFNAVMAKAQLDKTYFPEDAIARRKKWIQTIETRISPGTGVLSIIAYHTRRAEAAELSVRVAQEVAVLAPNYFGYSVRAQIIDDPLPSRFFVKPDLVKNSLFGAIAGFLLGAAWVLGRRNP